MGKSVNKRAAKSVFEGGLAKMQIGVRYVDMPNSHVLAALPSDGGGCMLDKMFSVPVDYGYLFSYLFHRFGFPNHHWDAEEEIACYLLATPLPDLILRVTPRVTTLNMTQFLFMLPADVHMRLSNADNAPHEAWKVRALDWYECNHRLPDWTDEMIACIRSGVGASLGMSIHTWRDAIGYAPIFRREHNGERMAQLHSAVFDGYAKVEREPLLERTYDWTKWPDDDHMKPYFEAAHATLVDLCRPVELGERSITIFGPNSTLANNMSVAKRAPVAGYALGRMGNDEPFLAHQFQDLVYRMGGGDPAAGMREIMAAFADR